MTDLQKAAEWKAKGNAAFQIKNYEEALSCFTHAIEANPGDHVLYSNRSGAYAALEKFEEALTDAEACLGINPKFVKGYSRKGLALHHLGRYGEAMSAYRAGLTIDPENANLKDALRSLVLNQRLQLQLASVLSQPKFAQCVSEDPSFPQSVELTVRKIMEDPEKARLALALVPDARVREAAMAVLGVTGADEDEDSEQTGAEPTPAPAKRQETAKKAEPKEDPRTPEEKEAEKWKEEGNALYKQKKFDEALEAYDKAIQKDPKEILYLNNKAAVYLQRGDFDKCVAECEKALEKRYEVQADFSKVAKVYCRLATCYVKMGKYDDAIKMYERALTEDNNRQTRAALTDVKRLKEKAEREAYVDPVKAEEHREQGNKYFKEKRFPEAKKEYDEAIKRNPSDPRGYSNRAAALLNLMEYPSALKDCDKAIELDATFVKAWARKGACHAWMKEYHKALTAYQKGLDIDPDNIECHQGIQQTMMKVQQMTSSETVDEEQVQHAMQDPEIQRILSDPQFNLILSNAQENPAELMSAMRDPKFASGLQKLMAAGILKVGTRGAGDG